MLEEKVHFYVGEKFTFKSDGYTSRVVVLCETQFFGTPTIRATTNQEKVTCENCLKKLNTPYYRRKKYQHKKLSPPPQPPKLDLITEKEKKTPKKKIHFHIEKPPNGYIHSIYTLCNIWNSRMYNIYTTIDPEKVTCKSCLGYLPYYKPGDLYPPSLPPKKHKNILKKACCPVCDKQVALKTVKGQKVFRNHGACKANNKTCCPGSNLTIKEAKCAFFLMVVKRYNEIIHSSIHFNPLHEQRALCGSRSKNQTPYIEKVTCQRCLEDIKTACSTILKSTRIDDETGEKIEIYTRRDPVTQEDIEIWNYKDQNMQMIFGNNKRLYTPAGKKFVAEVVTEIQKKNQTS